MTMFALQNNHSGYCAGKGWRRAVEDVTDQLVGNGGSLDQGKWAN